jgi:hypothetical protein
VEQSRTALTGRQKKKARRETGTLIEKVAVFFFKMRSSKHFHLPQRFQGAAFTGYFASCKG